MKRFNQTFFVTALTLGALFARIPAADAHEIKIGNLVIHHPWIKQPIAGTVAAAYASIENAGKEDDTLLKVTVEGVRIVQVHAMKMEGDVMKMGELKDGLVIPSGKTVELKPKSDHIMLMNLTSMFKVGQEVKGTFTFAKVGTVDLTFEVETGKPDMGGMKMNSMKMN